VLAVTQVIQALAALAWSRTPAPGNGMLDCQISAGIEITVRVYPPGRSNASPRRATHGGQKRPSKHWSTLGRVGPERSADRPGGNHRHDVQMTYTGEHNATVYIHSAVSAPYPLIDQGIAQHVARYALRNPTRRNDMQPPFGLNWLKLTERWPIPSPCMGPA